MKQVNLTLAEQHLLQGILKKIVSATPRDTSNRAEVAFNFTVPEVYDLKAILRKVCQ